MRYNKMRMKSREKTYTALLAIGCILWPIGLCVSTLFGQWAQDSSCHVNNHTWLYTASLVVILPFILRYVLDEKVLIQVHQVIN